MCDLTQEFKLCSCGENELTFEQTGWILERRNDNKEIVYKRGEPAINFHSDNEKKIYTSIQEKLNNSNCFDFEYTPQEDDFLQIKKTANMWGWFAFRFKKGQWIKDDSTSFDEWRLRLDLFDKGKVSI